METGPPPPTAPSSEPAIVPARRLPPGPVLGGLAVVLIAAAVVVGAVWVIPALSGRSPEPSGGARPSGIATAPSALTSPPATDAPGLRPSPAGSGPRPTSTTLPGGPFASTGSIAVVGNDGSLSLVTASGLSKPLAPAGDGSFLFPAWSPDGLRIAAIHAGPPDNAILVFDASRVASGQPAEPVVIFRSAVIGPFYLSWTPDGRSVSFLADEPDGLSLRVAPADGSAPLDGTGPGAKIRSGNPFYFDWIGNDRLLAHVGTGPFAFLGEIGLDGKSAAADLPSPGDFRSAVVNHDGTFDSFVRSGPGGSAEIVVAARDGSTEHTMPVFGTAAVAFDPAGDTIASIGPTQPPEPRYTIPLGSLRLLDARAGTVRTLLEGSVVSFWWSPDGKMIAALRVQPVAGATPSKGPSSPTGPAPSATEQPTEIRLLFVDVATGEIRSQPIVHPGQQFIDQVLTYFDQYALSHRLWAPDSSSLLFPVADANGATRIAVMHPNGDPPVLIDGAAGFWSP
ncbi:MAG TPA: hypothetical protein VFY18_14460 [Candidatus Limnocylindrales bacterium]|nr:hypothetical protein [Candidatus Limnocylindrales bacterium]